MYYPYHTKTEQRLYFLIKPGRLGYSESENNALRLAFCTIIAISL